MAHKSWKSHSSSLSGKNICYGTTEAAAVHIDKTLTTNKTTPETQQVQNTEVYSATADSDVDNCHEKHNSVQLLQTDCNREFQTIIFNTDGDTSSEIELILHDTKSLSSKVIKTSLEAVLGLQSQPVDSGSNRISFSFKPDVSGPKSCIIVVESTETGNFQVLILSEGERQRERHREETNKDLYCLLFSLVHVIFSLVTSMVFMFDDNIRKGLDYCVLNLITLGAIIRWAVATVMEIIALYLLCTAPREGFACWIINMDVLNALKATIIYSCSLYSLLRTDFHGMDFFGTSSNFMTFCLLGRYLDSFVRKKRSLAISNRQENLEMETAILLDFDHRGSVTKKDLDSISLRRTDVMRIILGATTVGKWEQCHCHANKNGVLSHYKGRIIGSESVVSMIAQLAKSDQLAEGPAQMFASSISRSFMFLGISVSSVTWVCWYLVGKFHGHPKFLLSHPMTASQVAAQVWISVIAIASSCSLPLSVKIAVMVATLAGANQGVLFQSGIVLERKHKVNCIVFNRRTLTKPEVVGTNCLKNINCEDFPELIDAAKANSRHALAKASTEYAQKHKEGKKNPLREKASDFVSIASGGVKAIIQDKEKLVGNKRLMVEHNVTMADDAERMSERVIFVSINGEISGVPRDQMKPEVNRVISILQSMGVTCMVTADNLGIAESIEQKVRELQDQGYVVAVVDADRSNCASLIAADVGIIINDAGGTTGIAAGAADVVVNNLENVITAIDISSKTISRNQLNSGCTILYNSLAVPIASFAPLLFGFPLQPWIAGIVAACSSVVLAISSYSLKFYKRPTQQENLREMDYVIVE